MKEYKICKGINKAISFNGCGKDVLAQTRKYGLCRACFIEWILETSEGEKHLNNALKKGKKN